MIRWKYLVPRLIILSVALLLLTTLSNPLSRMLVVNSIQSVTGAKVDLGLVDVNFLDGRVQLNDIQITDPQNPMQNLIQAESIELHIDSMQWLHRRWVIESAKVERLQFGTPRIESGHLPNSDPPGESRVQSAIEFANKKAHELGKSWAEQIEARLPAFIEDQLESVRVSNEVRARWPSKFQQYRNTAADLRARADRLRRQFGQKSENPLRDLRMIQESLIEAQQISMQFQRLQRSVRELPLEFQNDRREIVEASQRDRQKIMKIAGNTAVHGDQLTELLLSQQQAYLVSQAATWLRRFRELAPNLKKDLQPEQIRGIDVPFNKSPHFVFRNLGLSGEAEFANKKIQFQGDINNLSDSPQLMSEPVTFDIRGSGELTLTATGTIDRRGPRPIDSVQLRCPSFSVPRKTLGDAETLLVEMEPSKMSFQLDARIIDNALTGTVVCRHSKVRLNIAQINPDVGGPDLAAQLSQQLAPIDSFDMTIALGGSLNKPTANLESDLGQHFAAALQQAFDSTIQTAAAEKTRRLDAILQKQLTELQGFFDSNSRQILGDLSTEIEKVASLQEFKLPGQDAIPRRFRR